MNGIFKDGLKLFGRTIIIGILSFFVVISIMTLGMAAFSEEIGYVAYGTKGDAASSGSNEVESEKLYTYYLADGEDEKLSLYEAQGYTVTKSAIKDMSTNKNRLTLIVAQFFSLGILICFIYPNLWDKGCKDNNSVKIGRSTEDKLKGLKIGVIANIPAVLLYLVLAVTKSGLSAKFPVALYKILNSPFYSVIQLIAGESTAFSDLGIGQLLLMAIPLLVVPAVAYISYYIGYKDIYLSEKFTYNFKKQDKRR